MVSGERLFIAERPFNGAATAVSWVSRDNSRFVVGFASGDLHLFWSESEKVFKQHGPYSISLYFPLHLVLL